MRRVGEQVIAPAGEPFVVLPEVADYQQQHARQAQSEDGKCDVHAAPASSFTHRSTAVRAIKTRSVCGTRGSTPLATSLRTNEVEIPQMSATSETDRASFDSTGTGRTLDRPFVVAPFMLRIEQRLAYQSQEKTWTLLYGCVAAYSDHVEAREILRRKRESLNLSQETLGHRIGKSRNSVWAYENGGRPTRKTAQALDDELGLEGALVAAFYPSTTKLEELDLQVQFLTGEVARLRVDVERLLGLQDE